MYTQVIAIFEKEEKMKENIEILLTCISHTAKGIFFQIWNMASSWGITELRIKIVTLFSLSIYSLCLHVSFFLGRTTHYHVPHNTLPCVLITLTCPDCPVTVVWCVQTHQRTAPTLSGHNVVTDICSPCYSLWTSWCSHQHWPHL